MGSASLKLYPTNLLIFANVSVYALTSVLVGNFLVTDIETFSLLGQVNILVVNGWYWQFFTSMFVHVNLLHLTMNMLFLLIFGMRAEELFSKKWYFFIYFASGLSGNLFTLLMGPYTVSAGASGAIFGIFGASVVYIGEAFGRSITSALVYSFFLLMLNSSASNVNILAHFGGLVAGLTIGYALAKTRKPF